MFLFTSLFSLILQGSLEIRILTVIFTLYK